MKFIISVECTRSGHYECRYGIAIIDYEGNFVVRLWSILDKFELMKGDIRQFDVIFNPLQIGEGEYLVSLCMNRGDELINLTQHTSDDRYDLLNKSFSFSVKAKAELEGLKSEIFHPTEWYFPPGN